MMVIFELSTHANHTSWPWPWPNDCEAPFWKYLNHEVFSQTSSWPWEQSSKVRRFHKDACGIEGRIYEEGVSFLLLKATSRFFSSFDCSLHCLGNRRHGDENRRHGDENEHSLLWDMQTRVYLLIFAISSLICCHRGFIVRSINPTFELISIFLYLHSNSNGSCCYSNYYQKL